MSHKKKSSQSKTDCNHISKSGNYTGKSDKNLNSQAGNNSYSNKSDSDSQNYSD